MREKVGGDTNAGVLNPDDSLLLLPLGHDRDPTAVLAVLGGVVQEVYDYLFNPSRVGVYPDRIGRGGYRQFVLVGVDEGSARLNRQVDDGLQLDGLLLELNLVPGDAAHVQQVVYQPGQLPNLAVDDEA